MKKKDELFYGIAKEHLRIETLTQRNSDSLDFHEVSVWGVAKALEVAFEAGKKEGAAVQKAKQTKQTRAANRL